MQTHAELVQQVVVLWYAYRAWGAELIQRSFSLDKPEDILEPPNRGCRQVPGTAWYVRTHGHGVDIFKKPDVGGVDFDFGTPQPASWQLMRFVEKQIRDGTLPRQPYEQLLADARKLSTTLSQVEGRQ